MRQIRTPAARASGTTRLGGAGLAAGGLCGSSFCARITRRDRSSLSIPAAGILETFNLAPDGINGGVQAGYNWQAANWVFGLEADIQGSTQKDNKTCILTCTPGLFAAYDATLPWFGTVRGRLGYSVGSTLFYASIICVACTTSCTSTGCGR